MQLSHPVKVIEEYNVRIIPSVLRLHINSELILLGFAAHLYTKENVIVNKPTA